MSHQTEHPKNVSQSSDFVLIARLEKLSTDYQNTRIATYTLLSECLKLVIEIMDDDKKQLELEDYLKAKKIKVIGKDQLYRQVVQAVIGADTKTASNYGKVLVTAAKDQIRPHELVGWIKENGGIEALVSSVRNGGEGSTDKFEIGRQKICNQESVGTVSCFEGIDKGEELVALVGRITANGDIEVLRFCPDQKILKTICRKAAGRIKNAALPDGEADEPVSGQFELESKMAKQAKPLGSVGNTTECASI